VQCFTCSLESFNKNLCTKCEEGYYPFYDYNKEYYRYFHCTKSPIGYYFDNEASVYKLCYSSCETCEKSGNETEHNCKTCKYGFNFEIHFTIYKNCYMNCSFYHYYDSGISYCTKNNECTNEYDKLIGDKSECVSNCTKTDQYKFEFRKKCHKQCPSNSTLRKNYTELKLFNIDKKYFCKPICYEEAPFEIIYTQECVKNCSIKYIIDKACVLNFKTNGYDIMYKNVEISFTSEEYDTTKLDNGINDIIEFDIMKIILTTSKYQRENLENPNETTIDLGKCESLLREKYNISYNESLYMRIIDIIQEGMKIPKIIYDIYGKLNKTHLVKLNLSI